MSKEFVENIHYKGENFTEKPFKADFRASYNFSIDPELNPIFKAKFSAQTIGGLLNEYKIVIE